MSQVCSLFDSFRHNSIKSNNINQTNIKLCLLNIRSIKNKTFEIIEIIDNNNIDIICLTETWLKGDESDSIYISPSI